MCTTKTASSTAVAIWPWSRSNASCRPPNKRPRGRARHGTRARPTKPCEKSCCKSTTAGPAASARANCWTIGAQRAANSSRSCRPSTGGGWPKCMNANCGKSVPRRRRMRSSGKQSWRNEGAQRRRAVRARGTGARATHRSISTSAPMQGHPMGKTTGFMEHGRIEEGHQSVAERLRHYKEFVIGLDEDQARVQGARCMDCGTPFCSHGCPVHNIIPDFNDLIYQPHWNAPLPLLHNTHHFPNTSPESPGRTCPAPCEAACVLNVNDKAVGIKSIEHAIIDRAWQQGWVQPRPARHPSGKKVAVVGSGPAGMAAAQQLARAGHGVTLFEKNDRVGGLLRYGIPDSKMEKSHIDRRIAQLQPEGGVLRPGAFVGSASEGLGKGSKVGNAAKETVTPERLYAQFDAVPPTSGAEQSRDLPVPGRGLDGIHFAMEFLPQQNKVNAGDKLKGQLRADGKHVIVIGGGDTGSACVGTSRRHGAASVTQFELLPRPPEEENRPLTRPPWPIKLRTSSSHEEGCARQFAIATREFVGDKGRVTGLKTVRVQFKDGKLVEIAGSEQTLPADLVLLAMGFVGPVAPVLDAFGVEQEAGGKARASTEPDGGYATNVPKVFAAGDMRRGQSLVVWAIREGRQAAHAVDRFLMGYSELPR